MTETPPILVLTDAGSSYYLLPRQPFTTRQHAHKSTWTVDRGELTPVRKRDAYARVDWYSAPGAPQAVTASRPGPSVRTGWTLRNPAAASEAFPLTRETLDDLDDDTATALYAAVYTETADEHLVVPVADMTVIDQHAAPAPDDGLHWIANLVDELKRHPELHHLFPGHLTGFREAVVAEIGRQPYTSRRGDLLGSGVHLNRNNVGLIDVYASVPYEPRHTTTVHGSDGHGRRRRGSREVVSTKRLEISIAVPSAITGANRAEAVEKWHVAMAEILAEVEEALTPAPCWHCQGTGVVSAKAAAGVAQ